MKRIWLLAFFFCFTASIASSQIRFSKNFGIKGFNDLSAEVLSLGDSGYFTVTQSIDLFNEDTLGFSISSVLLVRTNKFGDTLWTKVYRKKNFNISFNAFIKTANGFILVGQIIDLSAYVNQQKGGYIAIWQLNEFGDTLSTQNFDIGAGNDFPQQIINTVDTGYIVIGQSCNQIQSGANCDLLLIKINNQGTIQWFKTFSNNANSFESGLGVIQNSNEDLYLVGYTSENSTRSGFLVKVNKDGNLLWKKKYQSFPSESFSSIIAGDKVDNFFISGFNSLSNSGNGKINGQIILIDTSGNEIWKKIFNRVSNCSINDLTLLNNTLVFSGYNYSDVLPQNAKGWLMKIKSNGDSILERIYNIHPLRSENIYSIKHVVDGFIMAGYSYNPTDSASNQDAWLLKVDTFGCLTPGCQLVGISNIPFSREEIKIYPNPANDKIQFEHSAKIISYRIADYTGKLLLEGAYNSINIDVSALPAGAYIVQVMLEDGSQAFGKMVVE